ncbi:hypothetical protein [Victivallis sp. Marseille-Q1083]|uniref:hypothetical protein n=1 Tax=Victivallis sp. Marseille-Q1083 TaxID=2717288 RepID=UPI00158B85DA|nr:hypothetical protein [Victivallis sp. Marseille-Q1083]
MKRASPISAPSRATACSFPSAAKVYESPDGAAADSGRNGTSAALFFGSLLPLAIKFNSGLLLPAIYGTATGLPVLFFAFLLAFGVNQLGRTYHRLAMFELWAQRITGIIFLLIGLYFTCTVTMGIAI